MNFIPMPLGIYANIYGSEDMPFGKAVLVAVVGFITVIVLLSIIALFIKLTAYVFSLFTGTKKPATPTGTAPAPSQPKAKATAMRGDVTLVDVDEPTAAVIMALVSHNSGIPLERLDFKSIKLLEDEK